MFAAFGIMLLIAGAIATFVVEPFDGVDVVAIGWILMAGGGLALLISMIDRAGWRST